MLPLFVFAEDKKNRDVSSAASLSLSIFRGGDLTSSESML